MFKILTGIFQKKNKDLRHRLYFTIAILTIFVIGTTIEVPKTQHITTDLGFLELLNVMSGGSLQRFSIFALGVSPYINASIIMQLLQMDVIPYFSDLAKQGQVGQQKLNQITRYMGIIFGFAQGYAMSFYFLGKSNGVLANLEVALVLTAGTALLMWLGDQVTQKGIGNGISLIIMAGIVISLPHMMKTAFDTLVVTGTSKAVAAGIASFILFIIVYLLVVIGIIYIEGAERRISIQYANKSTSSLGKQNYMPIKINSAGVIPVIFASTLLSVPQTIAQFINKTGFTNFVSKYLDYTKPFGFGLFIVLIFFFAYFYTFVQLKPADIAKNLQDNGGYVPGVKPGESTEKYFSKVISRLTITGALFLAVIASLPIVVNAVTKLPSQVSIGGTSLLIVVGVAIETYKQLESSLLSRNYSVNKNYRRVRR